jgi:hypothetical protein
MTVWERFLTVVFSTFWREYFSYKMLADQAVREVPDAESDAVLARFRDAVARLPQKTGDPRSDKAP